jgi:hypothetical protein
MMLEDQPGTTLFGTYSSEHFACFDSNQKAILSQLPLLSKRRGFLFLSFDLNRLRSCEVSTVQSSVRNFYLRRRASHCQI